MGKEWTCPHSAITIHTMLTQIHQLTVFPTSISMTSTLLTTKGQLRNPQQLQVQLPQQPQRQRLLQRLPQLPQRQLQPLQLQQRQPQQRHQRKQSDTTVLITLVTTAAMDMDTTTVHTCPPTEHTVASVLSTPVD